LEELSKKSDETGVGVAMRVPYNELVLVPSMKLSRRDYKESLQPLPEFLPRER
jgi:hypothetical protein